MAGRVPHPLLEATRELFERTVAAGHGPDDWTAVIEPSPAGD